MSRPRGERDFTDIAEMDKLAPDQVANEVINAWENANSLEGGDDAKTLVEAVKKCIEEERTKREPDDMVMLIDAFEENVRNVTAIEDGVSQQVEETINYLKEVREEFVTL